jgi:hypothetical protein
LIKFIENRHKKPSPIKTDNKKSKAKALPTPFEKLFVKDGIGAKSALNLLRDFTTCLDENGKWIDGKNQTDIITWVKALEYTHQIKEMQNIQIVNSLNNHLGTSLSNVILSHPKNEKLFTDMIEAIKQK